MPLIVFSNVVLCAKVKQANVSFIFKSILKLVFKTADKNIFHYFHPCNVFIFFTTALDILTYIYTIHKLTHTH